MIVSFKNKFVFIAIPKTATHTIRAQLRPSLGESDWEQCTLFEKRYFPVSDLAAKGHGHLSVNDIQPYLIPGQWDAFFSFAFVRNPYDRFVSLCTFYQKQSNNMQRDPLGTMKTMLSNRSTHAHVLLQPQHSFLCRDNGELNVDFIGRYENLQNDFNKICSRLNFETRVLPVVNASNRGSKQPFIDEELKNSLLNFYKNDFEIFDYKTELPSYFREQ